MKRSVLLCLGLFAVSHALAQATAESLDLRLPEQPNPYAAESSPQRDLPGDPPGTYYGDTSGKPAWSGLAEEAAADDGKAKVWGSFTTGIGHTKGYGTSHYNAAEINVSKSFGEGERKSRVNLQINVEQADGPGFGRYSPYPYFDPQADYPPPR